MRRVLLFLLLVSACFAYYANPPLSDVGNYNANLASSLQPFPGNPGGVPENPISFDTPVAFVDGRVLAALPSAGGRISDRNETKLLWGWGERHGDNLERETHSTCADRATVCTTTVMRKLKSAPEPKLTIKFLMNGSSRDAAANLPLVPLAFTQEELASFEPGVDENNQSIDPVLNVSMAGSIFFDYEDTYYPSSCDCKSDGKGGSSCGCRSEPSYTRSAAMDVAVPASYMNFTVDSGNSTGMIVQPFTNEVTPPFGKILAGIYTRREVWRYVLKVDGKAADADYFYKFDVSQDAYRVKHIDAVAENYSGLKADDADAAGKVDINSSSYVAASRNCTLNTSDCMRAYELSRNNDSYSRIYQIEENFSNLVGKHTIALEFSDMDGGSDSLGQNVSARYITFVTVDAVLLENASKVQVSAKAFDQFGPLNNSALVVFVSGKNYSVITGQGGTIEGTYPIASAIDDVSVCFFGDDTHKMACTTKTTYVGGSGGIDWSVFSFGLILLAIFVGTAYQVSGHVFGIGFFDGAVEGIGFLPLRKLFRPNIRAGTVIRGGIDFGKIIRASSGEGGGSGAAAGAAKGAVVGSALKGAAGEGAKGGGVAGAIVKGAAAKTGSTAKGRILERNPASHAMRVRNEMLKGKRMASTGKHVSAAIKTSSRPNKLKELLKKANVKPERARRDPILSKIADDAFEAYKNRFELKDATRPAGVIVLKGGEFERVLKVSGQISEEDIKGAVAVYDPNTGHIFCRNEFLDGINTGRSVEYGFLQDMPEHKYVTIAHEVGHTAGALGNAEQIGASKVYGKVDEAKVEALAEEVAKDIMPQRMKREFEQRLATNMYYGAYEKEREMLNALEGVTGREVTDKDFENRTVERTAKKFDEVVNEKGAFDRLMTNEDSKQFVKQINEMKRRGRGV